MKTKHIGVHAPQNTQETNEYTWREMLDALLSHIGTWHNWDLSSEVFLGSEDDWDELKKLVVDNLNGHHTNLKRNWEENRRLLD
jgi:hypothetical protein